MRRYSDRSGWDNNCPYRSTCERFARIENDYDNYDNDCDNDWNDNNNGCGCGRNGGFGRNRSGCNRGCGICSLFRR